MSGNGFRSKRKEKASLDLMRSYAGKEGHRFVEWSGGKDSTLVLHLACRAWGSENFKAVFADTGITLPETLQYIETIKDLWGVDLIIADDRKGREFWSYAIQVGFPTVRTLWCRTHFKVRPLKRRLEKFRGWKYVASGIRRLESTARMKSPFYQRDIIRSETIRFCIDLFPIRNWRSRDVARYYRVHRIPENIAYKIYKTSGCYFCPFVRNPKHYLALKNRHPDLFQKIVETERRMRRSPGHAFPEYAIQSLIPQTHLEVI